MNKYYVYVHRDLDDNIVYVGKGTGGRAWDVTRCRGQHKEHQEWMQKQMERGFIPSDWTDVLYKGLTEKDAYTKEKEILHRIGGTIFNRQSGERNYQAKLTDEQARSIYVSKDNSGVLSRKYGVSRAAIQMIKTGKQWRAATACLRN